MDDIEEDNSIAVGDREIVMGFRLVRSRTNWLYRGTSALTTTMRFDLSELDDFYQDLEVAIAGITVLAAQWAALGRSRLLQGLQESYRWCCRVFSHIQVCVSWLVCCAELTLLDMEDRMYFVHHRHRFADHMNRTIDSISDDNESYHLFGFTKEQMSLLLVHWRIPQFFCCDGTRFTGEEAMLIYLCHIRSGTPYTHLSRHTFGGDPRRFTYYMRAMINHLYSTFYHKISGDSMRQWVDHIQSFREAICNVLVEGQIRVVRQDRTYQDYQFLVQRDRWRVFGWLDDTDMQTTRPRRGIVPNPNPANPANQENAENIEAEQEETIDIQRAFYNKYFRGHGLKAQVVLLPNEMIANIYISSIRNNDNGVQNMSGLNDYLVSRLNPIYQGNDGVAIYPALYGDAIFTPLATIVRPIQNPTEAERILNTRMSSLRENIEHKFADIFGIFRLLRMTWRHNLFYNGEDVRKLFFTILFVSNCHTCFNESRNARFNLRAPSIQNYLPLNEVLQPAPRREMTNTLQFL